MIKRKTQTSTWLKLIKSLTLTATVALFTVACSEADLNQNPNGESSSLNQSSTIGQSSSNGQSSGTQQSSRLAPSSSSQSSSSVDPLTLECGGKMPSPISGGTEGYATRYWDCCKPHCSWPENTVQLGQPNGASTNCLIDDTEVRPFTDMGGWYDQTTSGCDAGGDAFTCYSQAPYAVCENLSYGYAAVPSNSPSCGKCYQIDFTGTGKYSTNLSHKSLKDKSMIVMASNIGHDVAGGQFDIMIPGGGVGAFTGGCSEQWNVNASDPNTVGETYGGFLAKCHTDLGYNKNMNVYKACVRDMCTNLFGVAGREDLMAGCNWYIDWMNVADNPELTYKEVSCPAELINGYKGSFN